jgi:hypothetical protein
MRLREILYRAQGFAAVVTIAFLFVVSVAPGMAQEDTPGIIPLERKQAQSQKKDPGPRALGLLQMTANGKATLVPIAIMIDGKFYDATAYKAAPVPMALYSGTVYEGERTGKSVGIFTVSGALRSRTPNAPTPWLGSGLWLPTGAEGPKNTIKAENVPVGMNGPPDEGPPRLTKNSPVVQDAPAPPANSPAGAPASTSPPSSTTPVSAPAGAPTGSGPAPSTPTPGGPSSNAPGSNAPASGSVPTGGTTTTPAQGQNPSSTAPAGQSQTPTSAPKDGSKTDGAKSDSSAAQSTTSTQTAPESDSGASESGRPLLRRGKPTEPLPDEEIAGYTKVTASGAAKSSSDAKSGGAKPGDAKAASPAPAGTTEFVPAISDAAGPLPHSFVYAWEHGEDREQIKQMLALASDQLRALLKARAQGAVGAKPAGTSAHRPAAKAKDPVFENVNMRSFDLWNNDQPVLVLTAEAHFPPSAGAAADAKASTTYSVTIAARTDIYYNLRKLYAGITDKYHLDVTPRLDLIDAVDADGDGRGELLFRETSDNGSGYVIYRAAADSLWKMFDSLNAQ